MKLIRLLFNKNLRRERIMKNRKMSQKITISFAVVIACFLITVVAMFFGMSNISGNYVNFYENGHTALAKTYEGRLYLQTALKLSLIHI